MKIRVNSLAASILMNVSLGSIFVTTMLNVSILMAVLIVNVEQVLMVEVSMMSKAVLILMNV